MKGNVNQKPILKTRAVGRKATYRDVVFRVQRYDTFTSYNCLCTLDTSRRPPVYHTCRGIHPYKLDHSVYSNYSTAIHPSCRVFHSRNRF